jgi:hypothetical protein
VFVVETVVYSLPGASEGLSSQFSFFAKHLKFGALNAAAGVPDISIVLHRLMKVSNPATTILGLAARYSS